LGDFRNQHVLELGCGDGRLTLGIAAEAASVLAFDLDAEAVRVAVSRQPL
jgi:predicted RNA methylase